MSGGETGTPTGGGMDINTCDALFVYVALALATVIMITSLYRKRNARDTQEYGTPICEQCGAPLDGTTRSCVEEK
jgi:hypothetical protein